MTKYELEMRDDGGGDETITIEADTLEEAHDIACSEVAEWCNGVDWGIEGASVQCWYTLTDEEGNEEDGYLDVNIECNEDALIKAAGGDIDCNHKWTAEGEGGCRENPGVWSLGGTSMSFATHCTECGLHRKEYITGSQKNPGDHDTVSFSVPESWCQECQSEKCTCEGEYNDY